MRGSVGIDGVGSIPTAPFYGGNHGKEGKW